MKIVSKGGGTGHCLCGPGKHSLGGIVVLLVPYLFHLYVNMFQYSRLILRSSNLNIKGKYDGYSDTEVKHNDEIAGQTEKITADTHFTQVRTLVTRN